jgi:hypothetical protein
MLSAPDVESPKICGFMAMGPGCEVVGFTRNKVKWRKINSLGESEVMGCKATEQQRQLTETRFNPRLLSPGP